MAKTRRKPKTGGKTKKVRTRVRKLYSSSPRMDEAARRYALLLTNPCTGPLVRAPGSTDGGQVARFESDFLLGTGTGITAGGFLWTPGGYNNNAGSTSGGFGMLQWGSSDDATASAAVISSPSFMPGYNFLVANASEYRCLAACAQVFWTGTELNRSGVVSGAQATRGLLNIASGLAPNITTAAMRSISPIVERMPSDVFEIKWAPTFADGIFQNPQTSYSAPEDGHGSLLVTYAGVPAQQGIRVRLVIVVEWKPSYNQNQVLSSNTADAADSAASIQSVRHELDKRDPDWWHNLGRTIGRLAANGVALGGGVYSAFARGPSVPRIGYRTEL